VPAGTFVQEIPGVVEEPVQVYTAGRADPAGTLSTVREKVPAAEDPVAAGTEVAVVVSGKPDDDGAVPEQPQKKTMRMSIQGRIPRAICMVGTSPAGQIYLTTTKSRLGPGRGYVYTLHRAISANVRVRTRVCPGPGRY